MTNSKRPDEDELSPTEFNQLLIGQNAMLRQLYDDGKAAGYSELDLTVALAFSWGFENNDTWTLERMRAEIERLPPDNIGVWTLRRLAKRFTGMDI